MNTTETDVSVTPFRVVFLIGSDSPSITLILESVCRAPGVMPAAILIDTAKTSLSGRIKNLRRNLRREGVSYVPARLANALQSALEAVVERPFPPARTREHLQRAFPERCFSIEDLSRKFNCPVIPVGSLNSPLAAETLRGLGADLGIVVGTRILKRSTFGVPRLGSVNLHEGAVPEYRGMPPGFWEIFNGEKQAAVTVHFVDDTLDTGDIVAESRFPILPLDTPDSLRTKLDLEGARTLAAAVATIQSGTVPRMPQKEKSSRKANTRPTARQVAELRRRLPHWNVPPAWVSIVKNLTILFLYHSGIYSVVKRRHERGKPRAAILLYHRVNDVAKDGVTASLERFAGHMEMIARWYKPVTSQELVDRLRSRQSWPSTAVAVHFDDCYRDVYQNAVPIMQTAGVPGAHFISSGFVGTSRVFNHDIEESPFRFENLNRDELCAMLAAGFEIGGHTINHVNLGVCPVEEAHSEIAGSLHELQQMTGGNIALFAFPFGKQKDFRPELREVAAGAGASCVFSAFGGYVEPGTDLYDIPRLGVSDMHTPLHLALEIEGISPNLLARRLRAVFTGARTNGTAA
jgi:peptidoglycan/xylan/chitin deacetylase (PgdA/CDA1 family)